MNQGQFRAFEWDETPLGPIAEWTTPLICWADFLLRCTQPALLLWGDQRVLLFNEAYAQTLGLKYLSLLGRPFEDVAKPLWNQLAPFVEDAFSGHSGQADDREFAIWRNGATETRYFSFAYTPIFFPVGASTPVGAFCSLTDRTEKVNESQQIQRQFERLHEIYERAPGFIAMAEGPEHRFTFANAAYRDLVGRQDVVGKTVAEALPEVAGQGFIDILNRVYQTGIPFVGRGLSITIEDPESGHSRKRFIDTIYHPVRDASGDIVGLFAEGHDVTQQVEAQRLAAMLQAQLLRVSRATAMESFGTAVAHEINQPLAATVNYLAVASKLIGKKAHEDRLATMIERASSAALRSGEILKRLRNLSAAVSERQRCDLVKIVIEAIALTRAASHSLSISTTALESCLVHVDPVQIQQVLVNLIKNAQEAMADHDDPLIEIAVARRATLAEIRVKDRGYGVDDEQVEQLFEWFMTTKAQGSGIGLPISKQIIEAHGGRIWVENDPLGAVFCVTLPLADGTEA